MSSYTSETPLKIRNNETYKGLMIFTDKNGGPLNFTGATALIQIKATQDINASVLYEFNTTVTSGKGTIDWGEDPTQGKAYLTADLADVEGFTWANGFYDFPVTWDGVTQVIAAGAVCIELGVSKSS